MCYNCISTDNYIIPNRYIPENYRTRTNHHIIANMRCLTQAVCARPLTSNSHSLKYFTAFTNDCFRMNNATNSSVVKNSSLPNSRFYRNRT